MQESDFTDAAEKKKNDFLNETEVCELFGISCATLKNWVRLGKLKSGEEGGKFKKSEIMRVYENISVGNDNRLKSRRNKKFAAGSNMNKAYISTTVNISAVSELMKNAEYFADEKNMRALLGHFAAQLVLKRYGFKDISGGKAWKTAEESAAVPQCFKLLLKELFGKESSNVPFPVSDVEYVKGEDFLGFCYNSLLPAASKKSRGAYFTPSVIADAAVELLRSESDISQMKIIDPCCGTGNFLLKMLNCCTADNLYGCDCDELSIYIAKINIALNSENPDYDMLNNNFKCRDMLSYKTADNFDAVIGNPPWGSDIKIQRGRKIGNIGLARESADVCTALALDMVKDGGFVDFVLPQSLLYVKKHTEIRRTILHKAALKAAVFNEDSFGVQCPSVTLMMKKGEKSKTIKVERNGDSYFLDFAAGALSARRFSLNVKAEEWEIISKMDSIPKITALKCGALFAMGIVTGANGEFVYAEKTDYNETVIRGRDIEKFCVKPCKKYIEYRPEKFQQCAPTEIYRAKEKLIYRFVSPFPVVAFEGLGRLSLNSANIIIPAQGFDIHYVEAILNSTAAKFYFLKKYNSAKMLRSFIEDFPIPCADEKTTALISGTAKKAEKCFSEELYGELDNMINSLYGFSDGEKSIILEATVCG